MRIFLNWIFCCPLCLFIFSCAGSVTEQQGDSKIEENNNISEKTVCFEAKPGFLHEDEKKLYRDVLKVPYGEIERNMSSYYKLSKINPSNKRYKDKYFHYAKIFYGKNEKYKISHYLKIESPNRKPSVPLLRRPNTGEFNKVSDVPDKTIVKILDYSVVRYTENYEGIWYLVEYCGQQGYVSEGWTDSIMNQETVKLLRP